MVGDLADHLPSRVTTLHTNAQWICSNTNEYKRTQTFIESGKKSVIFRMIRDVFSLKVANLHYSS